MINIYFIVIKQMTLFGIIFREDMESKKTSMTLSKLNLSSINFRLFRVK